MNSNKMATDISTFPLIYFLYGEQDPSLCYIKLNNCDPLGIDYIGINYFHRIIHRPNFSFGRTYTSPIGGITTTIDYRFVY